MGQYELIQVIKAAKGRKMTVKEIMEEYNKRYYSLSKNSISVCLAKLRKFNMVNYDCKEGVYMNKIYRYWI